jgi:Zn-dependent peptidase ImmA (M78 family)/DNA-binding XRE family transcriptional regulator
MKETIRADINPEILEWARKSIRIPQDEAARKIRVSENTLRAWESGEKKPTLRQLRLIGKAYRRPSAFFYLDSPPEEAKDMPDYRVLPDQVSDMPPELIYEIRKARYRRERALELFYQMNEEVPDFSLSKEIINYPEQTAENLRKAIGISINQQRSWKNKYEALNGWIMAIENSGVMVFQFSGIDVKVVRGFSIAEFPLPIISLNGGDSPYGRIFTLIHELTHLSMGAGGLCDLHNSGNMDDIEVFCNAIAGAVLVPREAVLSDPLVVNNSNSEWQDNQLEELSSKYQVSNEVILRRLLTLGKTTNDFYKSKREEFTKAYAEISLAKKTSGGFLPYHKKVLRNNGKKYTSLILDAYRQQAISAIEVSRYLGDIKLNHLFAIEGELANGK